MRKEIIDMCAKRRSKRSELASAELSKIEKVQALRTLRERSERIEAMKVKSLRYQEESMLALATALIIIKCDLNLSWESLSSELGEVANSTTLYKIAQRQIYVALPKFRLIALAAARYAGQHGVKIPLIPEWQDWRETR